jgi:hypothetical protein
MNLKAAHRSVAVSRLRGRYVKSLIVHSVKLGMVAANTTEDRSRAKAHAQCMEVRWPDTTVGLNRLS